MGGRTSAASKYKYNCKAYDRLAVMVPKGDRDIIKEAAEAEGKSINAYVVEAIADKMRSGRQKNK